MRSPFQSKQDVLDSINLTAQLETSLRKLLTNKKKSDCGGQCIDRHRDHERLLHELEALRAEKVMLASDNQLLSRELLACRQQVRELGKEVGELKKYADFLQGYNCSLKKEMAYWVKKPRTQQVEEGQPGCHVLSEEIGQLKRMNELREKQLCQLDSTVIVKGPSKQFPCARSASTSKKFPKDSITLSKSEEHQCTGCSLGLKGKGRKGEGSTGKGSTGKGSTRKGGKMSNNKSFTGKRKKLCSCHKSYVETSDFLY